MYKRLLAVAVFSAFFSTAQMAFAGDVDRHVIWGVTSVTAIQGHTTPDLRQGIPIQNYHNEDVALQKGNSELGYWRLRHAFITELGIGFTKQKAGFDYSRDIRPEVRVKRRTLAI